MRVLMLEPASRQKGARLDQGLDDRLVRIALFTLVVDDPLALEARGFARESAVFVDGLRNSEIDSPRREAARARRPELEVLSAVTGRSVDEAGSGVVGDVIAGEERDIESRIRLPTRGADAEQAADTEDGRVTSLSRSNASTLASQNVPRQSCRPKRTVAPTGAQLPSGPAESPDKGHRRTFGNKRLRDCRGSSTALLSRSRSKQGDLVHQACQARSKGPCPNRCEHPQWRRVLHGNAT